MEKALTPKERANVLMNRARRLHFFVETFRGRSNFTIENEAYLVLEVYQSRPRAIWRYIRFAIKEWRKINQFRFELTARVWWYQRIKGLNRDVAINLAHKTIEGRINSSMKGAAHGRRD
jgi:hypothetical protein